jgi:hypothetical protein
MSVGQLDPNRSRFFTLIQSYFLQTADECPQNLQEEQFPCLAVHVHLDQITKPELLRRHKFASGHTSSRSTDRFRWRALCARRRDMSHDKFLAMLALIGSH